MTRALRRTLRDAPIAWLLTLLVGFAAGLLRYVALSLAILVFFGACAPPPRFPDVTLREADTTAVIRPGTRVRVSFTEQDQLEPRLTFRQTGKLERISADSLTIIGPYQDERITLPLSMIVRVDTAAGHQSRLLWMVLGVPFGMAGGALLCTPSGGDGMLGCAFLGTLVGPVVGGVSASERWNRVRSFRPTTSTPSAGAARETARSP